MKAVSVVATVLVLASGLAIDPGVSAAGPGGCCCRAAGDDECCGPGYRGGRGRGPRAGQGPPWAHHEAIHALLDNHEAIERSVRVLDDGVVTVTTSDDPAITEKIRLHVRQMEQRMKSGHGLRWWDPVFAELFRNHDKVRMEIEEVPGGVRVRETSDDPDVVLLIHQHALRGVSEFVEDGHARARQETPLPEDYTPDEDAARPCGRRGRGF
jgi:hypothetical protein